MMLTLSQQKTLLFIKKFIKANNLSPTIAEITHALKIKARSATHSYVKALSQKGYLSIQPQQHRNIRLTSLGEEYQQRSGIPLLGKIAAGQPIEAIIQEEKLDVESLFTGTNLYALHVKGDSMIDEGILEGDIIICHRCNTAENGKIVIALINNTEATLKKLQNNHDGTLTLLPANTSLTPMTYPADQVQIQGTFMGLIRRSPS